MPEKNRWFKVGEEVFNKRFKEKAKIIELDFDNGKEILVVEGESEGKHFESIKNLEKITEESETLEEHEKKCKMCQVINEEHSSEPSQEKPISEVEVFDGIDMENGTRIRCKCGLIFFLFFGSAKMCSCGRKYIIEAKVKEVRD